jgi:hypothetical protein
MPSFTYDRNHVQTVTALKVSVADIRDLTNAAFLPNKADQLAEIQLILSDITFKNMLPPETLNLTGEIPNPANPPQTPII